MTSIMNGFGLGLGLIVAIGAQNAFVLRMGLLRQHVFLICLICAISDSTLIVLGVAGIGSAVHALPQLEHIIRLAGAAYLIWLGARSAWSAWTCAGILEAGTAAGSRSKAVLTVLALTWLNPHVYVDTVLLLGALSAQFPSVIGFGVGASLASFMFFFALGYGARLLAPIMARPVSWRVLDAGIALVMWSIAFSLLMPE